MDNALFWQITILNSEFAVPYQQIHQIITHFMHPSIQLGDLEDYFFDLLRGRENIDDTDAISMAIFKSCSRIAINPESNNEITRRIIVHGLVKYVQEIIRVYRGIKEPVVRKVDKSLDLDLITNKFRKM